MTDRPTVTIYTDGGSLPNPGPGGWAAVLIAGNGYTKELSGAEPDTTNNRMELTAAIEALRALKGPSRVTLYTDSEYLRKGITEWLPGWVARGWRRKGDKPVENEDLWRALHAETGRHAIDWQWVKGHAGNTYNERVDRLATEARRRLTGEASPAADRPAPAGETPAYEIALRVSVPKTGGAGGWAARIAATGEDASPDTSTGRSPKTTSNRLILEAALAALQAIPGSEPVRLYCPDDYLYMGLTTWIAGWQVRGWKTKSGSPVKHQDLWRALADEMARRPVDCALERERPTELARDLEKLAADAVDPR